MLAEKFDEEIQNSFEGGRYRHVFDDSADERRVTRGLAEIHMLDRQVTAAYVLYTSSLYTSDLVYEILRNW